MYGSHLSQEVINKIIAPKDESTESVMAWLKSEGLTGEMSPRADSVIVEASISRVEKLLNAKYEAFGKPTHLALTCPDILT